jgi:hypothetical protein
MPLSSQNSSLACDDACALPTERQRAIFQLDHRSPLRNAITVMLGREISIERFNTASGLF